MNRSIPSLTLHADVDTEAVAMIRANSQLADEAAAIC
jgi:hypothetical protein